MIDFSQIDYTILDRPEILFVLFHPRREEGRIAPEDPAEDLLIPVEKDVVIGGRFYPVHQSAPTILFFHGNGEIASDYDDIGPLYNRLGINFLVVDYRGYGRSTGSPAIASMMKDAHTIFEWALQWLQEKMHDGPLIVMGRSLGSASALEIAAHHENRFEGLVIESGFSHVEPLLNLMGIDMKALGVREPEGSRNIDKIKTFHKPTLIIHAEFDHLIPFAQGQALYDASPAASKKLCKIPDADHNTIFISGMSTYMQAVQGLIEEVDG